jgi:hypothetical protein
MGLLAETAALPLSGNDAHYLRQIAALPDDARDDALENEAGLLDAEIGVPADARTDLSARLGIYGIGLAVEYLRRRSPDAGGDLAEDLARFLLDHSHLASVVSALTERFYRRAELIKAHVVLTKLDRLAVFAPGDPARQAFRTQVNNLLVMRGMVIWRVAEEFERYWAREYRLPLELARELELLARGPTLPERVGLADPDASPQRIYDAVIQSSQRWRDFDAKPTTSMRQHAAHDVVAAEHGHIIAYVNSLQYQGHRR